MLTRPTRRDLIAILFKQRQLFLLLLLGAVAGGVMATMLTPRNFTARAELVLPAASHVDPAAAQAVQRALLLDTATQRNAIESVGLASLFPDLATSASGSDRGVERIASGLAVHDEAGGRVLAVSLALARPEAARKALTALLHQALDAAAAFEARSGAPPAAAYLLLAEPAPPADTEAPQPLPVLAAATIAGLLLALAGVAAAERIDDRFTTPWQTARALSLPVLASFPRQGEAADPPRRNRQV